MSRIDWSKVDWNLSTSALAEATRRPAYYVSARRREHAPWTLAYQSDRGTLPEKAWCRFTTEQKQWLDDRAAQQGITPSEVIRRAVDATMTATPVST